MRLELKMMNGRGKKSSLGERMREEGIQEWGVYFPGLADQMNQLPVPRFRITRPQKKRNTSLKYADPKFRRNHRRALRGTLKALV